jgi:hypothetical protein
MSKPLLIQEVQYLAASRRHRSQDGQERIVLTIRPRPRQLPPPQCGTHRKGSPTTPPRPPSPPIRYRAPPASLSSPRLRGSGGGFPGARIGF